MTSYTKIFDIRYNGSDFKIKAYLIDENNAEREVGKFLEGEEINLDSDLKEVRTWFNDGDGSKVVEDLSDFIHEKIGNGFRKNTFLIEGEIYYGIKELGPILFKLKSKEDYSMLTALADQIHYF